MWLMGRSGQGLSKKLWVPLLLAAAAAAVMVPWGRPAERPRKVGVLITSDVRLQKLSGLRDGLRDLGLAEGRDFVFEIRNARNDREKLDSLAEDLAALQPDVIVAGGYIEAAAVKRLTVQRKIPVVFMGVASSVAGGLVSSLRNPGGNLTGIDNYHAELTGKRLEFLVRLLPGTKRVLVLYDPEVVPGPASLSSAREAARKLRVELREVAVTSEKELLAAVSRASRRDTDAILLLSSFMIESSTKALAPLAMERRLPVMGVNEGEAAAGYFASYGASFYNQGLQAARLVLKVLHGQDPAAIPVETSDLVQLAVNLDTARKLKVNPSPSGLGLADVIIGDHGGPEVRDRE